MKKFYLSLLLLAGALNASADSVVQIPEGATRSVYCFDATYSSMYGWMPYYGLSQYVYEYEDSLYFSNLFPILFKEETPVKAIKKGDVYVIPSNQMLVKGFTIGTTQYKDTELYTSSMMDSDDGYSYLSDDDIILYPTDQGGFSMTQNSYDVAYFALKDQKKNLWAAGVNFSFTPYTPVSDAVDLPSGVVPNEYSYSYSDDLQIYTHDYSVISGYYQDGNHVYLSKLTPDVNSWVLGEIVDGKLIVPTDQFLGAHNLRLLTFKALKNYSHHFEWINEAKVQYDEYYDFDYADALTFTRKGDSWILDEGQAIMEQMPDGSMYHIYYGFKIKAFQGFDVAVPNDAVDLRLEDLTSYFGAYSFYFHIPLNDTEGSPLVLENLSVGFYINEEKIALDPKDGYQINEPMDWIPYGFVDNGSVHDIMFNKANPNFYIYGKNVNSMGVQIRYTCDGVSKYSNIVNIDTKGNIYTIEADENTGISGTIGIDDPIISSPSDGSVYSVSGQRIAKPYTGQLYIQNGKKFLGK